MCIGVKFLDLFNLKNILETSWNVAGEREGSGEMDVAGNNAGTDSPGDFEVTPKS